jgi:4-hydroxybenzoate polyprenyltransferase/phosphoserine phosphatase
MMHTMTKSVPLCVDCDGTLIRTDLLHESVMLLMKRSPMSLLKLPFWLMKGRAHLKQQVSQRVSINATTLPYEPEIIELIKRGRSEGRTIVLATASPRQQAMAIADHLALFDRVEATDAQTNLAGSNKAAHLERLFGRGGFEYAGNSRADIPVWAASSGAIVVSRSKTLRQTVEAKVPVLQVIEPTVRSLKVYAKAIRVHQWLKNLLVFVPLLAAHDFSFNSLISACVAFVAFSLCASGVYVINDLLDLPSDRVHARKRTRPFASGAVPIAHGVVLAPVLLLAAVLLALMLPAAFAATLLAYFAVTCLYSFWLKNQVIVDVLMLASLYTSRIIAGAAATSIVPSFWLLAFSMFMFLSLAIVKRYSEMLVVLQQNKQMAAGRGYLVSDLPVLVSLGTAAGYMATLVLALYVNSPDLVGMYSRRWALWLVLPPLLYWISRVWMKAHRGELHDDPVVFAATDWQSWVLAVVITVTLLVATL